MASTLEKELFSYILQLDEAEKKSVLQLLKTFLKGRTKNASQIDITQYNQEIDEVIARVESGDYFTQDDVDKMSKDW